ncbi:MAG: ABC transporter ATP-binding protein [Syntrophales bacterium]
MDQGEKIIDIKNLNFSYSHGKTVFEDLNFSLTKGERVGLTGANGAGKTTLFHLIMGLLKPHTGEIEIFGQARREEKDFTEVRRRIGLVFQDSDDQLFCPTVEEDIAFGPLNFGKSHEEAKAVVEEICDRLGLKGFERKITHRLSGGEKRLVALATVAAMNPECFLLDEPVTGLDEATTGRFLKYLHEYGNTYVIITHNREFLKNAVDKVYVLRDSKIIPL